MKAKTFQIVIEVDNGMTIFDRTNNKKEIDEWVDAFTSNQSAKSITIYEHNKKVGAYEVTRKINRAEEKPIRLVGFERWK